MFRSNTSNEACDEIEFLSPSERNEILFVVCNDYSRFEMAGNAISGLLELINTSRSQRMNQLYTRRLVDVLGRERAAKLRSILKVKEILDFATKKKEERISKQKINIDISKCYFKKFADNQSIVILPNIETARNFHGKMRVMGKKGYVIQYRNNPGVYLWLRTDTTAIAA